jgi:NAD(P)-dependent dehydrogenase (short-subunit alcohol dehydrogenase family)
VACSVVIGGTGGLGLVIAQRLADRGDSLVITSRDLGRAETAAGKIGSMARGLAAGLSEPGRIADALAGVGPVDKLVICAIDQTPSTLAGFDVEAAIRVRTGPTRDRLSAGTSGNTVKFIQMNEFLVANEGVSQP